MFSKYFDKMPATSAYKAVANTFGGAIKSKIMSTQQLAELLKPINRKFVKL